MYNNGEESQLKFSNDFNQENINGNVDFPINIENNKKYLEINLDKRISTRNYEEVESISSKYKDSFNPNYDNNKQHFIETKIDFENSSLKESQYNKFNSNSNEIRNIKKPDDANQLNIVNYSNQNYSFKLDKNESNKPPPYEKTRIREKTPSYIESNCQESSMKMNEKKTEMNGNENKIEKSNIKTKKKTEITLMNTNFLDSDEKQKQPKINDHKKKSSNNFDDENKENNSNMSNLIFKTNIPSIKFERVSLLSDSSEDVILKNLN